MDASRDIKEFRLFTVYQNTRRNVSNYILVDKKLIVYIQSLSKKLSKANIPKYLNTDHMTAISMRQLAGL